MNIIDIVIIVVCAALGWTIVSAVIRKKEVSAIQELCRRELSDDDVRASWTELLQVEADASAEAIDAAYVARVKALRDSFPTVMTEVEQRSFQHGQQLLERAKQLAGG